MAKVSKITRSFNSGELSPLMNARSDQAKYDAGAKTMENYYPLIYGAAKRRPGLEYIATQKDVDSQARSIDFEHSVDDTYNLVFENQVIRIFKDGDRVMNSDVDVGDLDNTGSTEVTITTDTDHGYSDGDTVRFDSVGGTTEVNYNGNHATEWIITVTGATTFTLDSTDGDDFTDYTSGGTVATILEVFSPYLTADLPSLKVEQSADVMFITHPSYEERKLSRTANTAWTLEVGDLRTGPFRDQNVDLDKTIVANGTTDSVTLTAVGHAPFVTGTTAGHEPSGATIAISAFADYDGTYGSSTKITTSTSHDLVDDDIIQINGTTSYNGQWIIIKIDADELYIKTAFVADDATGELTKVIYKAQTGALFELIHAMKATDATISHSFTGNESSAEILVAKGVTWDFVTTGTWVGTLRVEREYGNSGIWETVHPVINLSARNISTSGEEEVDDAQYRITMSNFSTGPAEVQFSIRDISHIGVVEITAVASATSATATVLTTLADTTATHRWSEGSFSNRRSWPIDVTISPEERLTFAGNVSEPLTIWGSVIGDFIDFALGTNDDDGIQFTLVGTGQQNRIRWMLSKDALVLGTVGGEHLLGASRDEEALTPTNVKAKIQTTYGSEDIAAILVNQAVLFVQRGGKKIREFLYNFEEDSHKADDLTVFANHITGNGIVDMAFQRTPDPRLWCVRSDGEIAVLVYERDQNVFSWCRYVTDGLFESVSVIFGGARSEDEIWVTVKRVIDGSDTRYIERFTVQEFDQVDEAMMLDAAKVVTSAFDSQNITLASDTVRCGEGLCNSSLCGGVPA